MIKIKYNTIKIKKIYLKIKNQKTGDLGMGIFALVHLPSPAKNTFIGAPGQLAEAGFKALSLRQECGSQPHLWRENIPNGEATEGKVLVLDSTS